MQHLGGFDIAIVSAFFAAVLAVGLLSGRRERGATDYFLAGRTLPWYLIGFSLYASNMSGASFVGLIGASYSHGMTVFNYEWTATLVLIVFALFILPVFLRARIFTVPEYLEHRFDRRARWLYSLFTLLALLFIDMAGALYAGSVVIGTAFPRFDVWLITAALALFAGIYTVLGGLKAVVVTDALQAVLMIVGAAAVVFFGLAEVGGLEALLAAAEPEQRQLMRPVDDAFLPWPGIAGVVLLGFYYWTLNQYFVQRALAARSLDEGRKGALFGGLLKLPNLFLMVVPGIIALQLFPGLETPDQAFPRLIFELLPIGLKGLVLTALIAAILSSLDSAFNAAASLLTMDFVRALRPRTGERGLLRVGRGCTFAMMIVAAGYAPLIESFGSLFQYFQSTLAYLVPPVVAVYFGGLFWSRTTAAGGFYGLALGLATGTCWFLAMQVSDIWTAAGLVPLHFTYVAVVMFLLSAAVMVVVSLAGRADGDVRQGWRASDLAAPSGPWFADYRWQAAGLGTATLGLLWIFR